MLRRASLVSAEPAVRRAHAGALDLTPLHRCLLTKRSGSSDSLSYTRSCAVLGVRHWWPHAVLFDQPGTGQPCGFP
eukprot:10680661-Lingulodinium_polyedra.AAC.1